MDERFRRLVFGGAQVAPEVLELYRLFHLFREHALVVPGDVAVEEDLTGTGRLVLLSAAGPVGFGLGLARGAVPLQDEFSPCSSKLRSIMIEGGGRRHPPGGASRRFLVRSRKGPAMSVSDERDSR